MHCKTRTEHDVALSTFRQFAENVKFFLAWYIDNLTVDFCLHLTCHLINIMDVQHPSWCF